MIESPRVRVNDVVQECKFDHSALVRQTQQPGKGARNGDNTQVNLRGLAPAPQEEREAERFVQDAGKRVGRIDRYRRQERFDPFRIKLVHHSLSPRFQLADAAYVNRFCRECGNKFLVPTRILVFHKLLDLRREPLEHDLRHQPVRSHLPMTLLHLLQKARLTHFHELVEIACRNRQEFYALNQGIISVERLFQHPAIELKPREMAIEKLPRIVKQGTTHSNPLRFKRIVRHCYRQVTFRNWPGRSYGSESGAELILSLT